jgi:hypothetical protein
MSLNHPNSTEYERAYEATAEERASRITRIWLGVLTAIALMLVFVQAWQYYLTRDLLVQCDPNGTSCYDSGYLPVSNKETTTFFFRHRLGRPPQTMDVWFSPTQDGQRAFLLTWRFQRPEAGNPISIEARADAIYVNVWAGVPIFGYFDPPKESWVTFTSGFYRIVARK